MSSDFDLRATGNHTPQGNRELISCHNGMVYVLEEIQARPRTVRLRNIDNLDGSDPDPELVAFEDLPRTLRAELRRKGIRYVNRRTTTLADAMAP